MISGLMSTSPPRAVGSSLSQVEETTLKQMLANLVIAKKAAAAVAAAEAKARKEKANGMGEVTATATAKTQGVSEGGLPESTRKIVTPSVENNKQTAKGGGEGGEGEGAPRGTGGQGEPGRRR